MPEYGLLSIEQFPYHISGTYSALQPGGPFSSSMRLSGVRTISSAKSTNFSFKRAYVLGS